MIPLSVPLDDTDFEALAGIARERLPMLSAEWTDYNYSDPGITLIELLAWIADTQIYAIGRDRIDERREMAGLLGIRGEGAKPAAGTVFATDRVTSPRQVAAGTRLVPIGSNAPGVEVAHDVTLWPIEIAAIRVETADGSVDHTASNAQPRATYAPFGEPPSEHNALQIVLKGDLDEHRIQISLGFELDEDDEAEANDELGDVAVGYAAADGTRSPVETIVDTTGRLRRSGVMVLAFAALGKSGAEHRLEFRANQNSLIPRLLRITPNALPVVQRAAFSLGPFTGTGRAGQTLTIEPSALLTPDEAASGRIWRLARKDAGDVEGISGPARARRLQPCADHGDDDVRRAEADRLGIAIRTEDGPRSRRWSRDFDDPGPNDPCYGLSERADGGLIEVRFGNGVNGLRPPPDSRIFVDLALSAGKHGDVAAGNHWLIESPRSHWENREPIGGGEDADDLGGLLARLRRTLRSDRTLATSRQIEDAARALPRAYGVARAAIVEGWERGRRRPASAATRTLIVIRKGDANETPDWLRAIGRELRPRIALAERLRIEAPVFRRLRVRVRAAAAAGLVPEAVAREIRAELADRLKPSGKKGGQWPIGQAVNALAVSGWIRRIAGVSALTELVLLDEQGRPLEGEALALGRGELPLLLGPEDDVRVDPGTRQ
jgi:hypothetical protein